MIQKEFTPKRTVCKVQFQIPAEWADKSVAVAGDFNDWNTEADFLQKEEAGWSGVVRLKPEQEYRFKYFVDGERWQNDDAADAYVMNEFGTDDSLVKIGN
ncbi:MAG: glycoside hydrolase [Bacteroidetes bacterium]|jgi:1,4-alpha-glucan branching enzyme|nr:MAG: glycoside hydrolase [Bacteroidota bacterium]PTM20296.1 MAG: glycoside hydrolase [Bacteroidota bacterium]